MGFLLTAYRVIRSVVNGTSHHVLRGRAPGGDQGRQPAEKGKAAALDTDADMHALRLRLADVGGSTSQDLGLGRVVGQVLVYLYLTPDDCPMDRMEADLRLSKAAVSIAARQLEQLSLIRRVFKAGDRRHYYRTADNLGAALQKGILEILQRKLRVAAQALEEADETINPPDAPDVGNEIVFLRGRIARARQLSDRVNKVIQSPLLRLLAR